MAPKSMKRPRKDVSAKDMKRMKKGPRKDVPAPKRRKARGPKVITATEKPVLLPLKPDNSIAAEAARLRSNLTPTEQAVLDARFKKAPPASPQQVADAFRRVAGAVSSPIVQPHAQAGLVVTSELPPKALEVTEALTSVAAQATLLKITDAESAKTAGEMLTQLATLKKKLEEAHTAATKPLASAKKKLDALFKPHEAKLKVADDDLRKKFLDYQTKTKSEAASTRASLLEQAEQAVEEGDANKAAELAIEATSIVAVPKTTVLETGSIQMKKRWTFEVKDLAKVPGEYMSLDETKVRQAIRAGLRDAADGTPAIPGIRIFEMDELAVSGSAIGEGAELAEAPAASPPASA